METFAKYTHIRLGVLDSEEESGNIVGKQVEGSREISQRERSISIEVERQESGKTDTRGISFKNSDSLTG